MKINKLIRQFGEHGNDYSPLEMGDKINEIIDVLEGNVNVVNLPEDVKVKSIDFKIDPKNLEEYAVRSPSTADRVYLIKDGKKHWIKNPETLKKLGFDFHKIKNITNIEMDKFEAGQPIDLAKPKVSPVNKPKDDGDKYNF